MSVLRFEPIADQIAKLISAADLLPAGVLEETRAALKLDHASGPLPRHTEEFLWHYFALVRAANELLGAPQFDRLARLSEQIEEEYMPGGPPMSPVYDSYSVQHVLGEVPHGPGDETPYSVLARLLLRDGGRRDFYELACTLGAAHLDLYRVTSAEGLSAVIEPVRGGSSFAVHLGGPFLRPNDRMLARVLPFRAQAYIADSPYLLQASERVWLDYFERVVAAYQRGSSAERGKVKQSGSAKQQARRRRQERLKAQRFAPEQVIGRHLKRGLSERFWLDYVMDGYAGERNGIVFLAGVPDRPELLPHSEHYQADLPPMARLRMALVEVAEGEGLLSLAEEELGRVCEEMGLPPDELAEHEEPLFMAYCTLGAVSERGVTALEQFESEADPDPELQTIIDALKRGWFSILRVDHIHLDRGLVLFDELRRKKLEVSERSATRQVARGDLLLGWLCEDEQGVLTLEGGAVHVPAPIAPALVNFAKAARATQPRSRGMDFRARASQFPIPLIVGLRAIRASLTMPTLVNTSGDPLQLATARYSVLDRQAALAGLARAFEPKGEESFSWLDDANTVLAELELSRDVLLVRVNSVERLERVKARIEQVLGAAVKPGFDAFDRDVGESVRERIARGGDRARTAPAELSPDVLPQVHAAILERIRAGFDQPIPQFKNQTLRQVARRERSRPDAVSWLREQERILKSNPQMRGLDMRPLWRDLGLEYQGLDSDPPLHAP